MKLESWRGNVQLSLKVAATTCIWLLATVLRVIAGQFKGRLLRVPSGGGTRPTADRVREAVFSMLGSMADLCVLDLYAGTGALGIEALSRGARQAAFVEASVHACRCIRENLSNLTLESRSRVVHALVERAKRDVTELAPYDLVFCDPPWSGIDTQWEFLARMNISELLLPRGRLVLEHPATTNLDLGLWGQLEFGCTRFWGDSAVTILKKADVRDDRQLPKDGCPEHPTTNDNPS